MLSAPLEPNGLQDLPTIGRYEWINSQLKEKPMGIEADEINGLLNRLLATVIRRHQLASQWLRS